jgi:alkylation response protein AidB-like acyl-CoA dehydrogenase
VDFELTDDQQELQAVVRDVAEAECPTALVRAVAEDRAGGDVDALWKTFVQLDWPSLTVPVDDGGMGLSAVELAITLEELGRVADPTPFQATTSQYLPLVRNCGDPEQRRTLLGAVCTGGTGAAALDPDDVVAHAEADGTWRLEGTARYLIDGDRADELAVVARTDELADGRPGIGVFVVRAAEVTATRLPSFDSTLHVAEVRLDGVRVAAERSMCGPDVATGVERARLEAITGVAASMVGASQRILELVSEHVRSRHQFGQPIGAFQAVKHMLVDVYIAIERARALCHFAALTLAEDDDRAALAASMAKAAAGDCQRIAAQHGVQLFGGLGFTWENDVQMFVRRAKAGELLLGSTAEHRSRVARITTAAVRSAGDDRGQ